MQSVKILFIVTVILIILAAVALVALAQAGDIHEAVKTDDLDSVRRLIEQDPALLEAPGHSNPTPLHYAAAYGHPDIAKYLLEKGAQIRQIRIDSRTRWRILPSVSRKR